jgi:hypothetical protein
MATATSSQRTSPLSVPVRSSRMRWRCSSKVAEPRQKWNRSAVRLTDNPFQRAMLESAMARAATAFRQNRIANPEEMTKSTSRRHDWPAKPTAVMMRGTDPTRKPSRGRDTQHPFANQASDTDDDRPAGLSDTLSTGGTWTGLTRPRTDRRVRAEKFVAPVAFVRCPHGRSHIAGRCSLPLSPPRPTTDSIFDLSDDRVDSSAVHDCPFGRRKRSNKPANR